MPRKPWNPRKLKNEITDALKEMHRLSCALAAETSTVVQNENKTKAIDIELIREGAEDLRKCMDYLAILWEIAGYPDETTGVLEEKKIL